MLLEKTLERIRPLDRSFEVEAQKRLDSLTKPQGSLGKLEELARRVAVIQGKVPPRLGRKLLFIFAADHGITEEGVSAYPKEVTAQMTLQFSARRRRHQRSSPPLRRRSRSDRRGRGLRIFQSAGTA